MKRIASIAGALVGLALAVLLLTEHVYLLRAVRVTWLRGNGDVTIHDHRVQPTRVVHAGEHAPWPLHASYNELPVSDEVLALLDERRSLAFLVIHDGRILSEHYFAEGGQDEASGVWSISKTYTCLLLLQAVQDGYIGSVDDPVAQYLPEIDFDQDEELTLRHLASMSTGLFWDEQNHTPFSLIAKLNFTFDLEEYTLEDMYATGEPGREQHYNSGGTQMLGTVLDRALPDTTTISDYLSRSFWKPLGCAHDARFVVDRRRDGLERTFGGLVATARDISRTGQLILDDGIWNGERILSEPSMDLLTTLPYRNETYTFGLWTGLYDGERFYYQAGFGGQYVITVPSHDLVITRLGHEASPREDIEDVSPDVLVFIDEAVRMVEEQMEDVGGTRHRDQTIL